MKTTTKNTKVQASNEIVIKDTVGVHFNTEKALEVGSVVIVKVAGKEFTLNVRYVRKRVNGLYFTMAFTMAGDGKQFEKFVGRKAELVLG